ncbi:MAG TPA: hypothetical protein VGM60_16855 [Pseudonocardia sp.]|uniref:hypothetical protein n=1 Tax=Pseudonocardia sp. TaxID=60912 RepID=UPI002F40FF0B
MAETRATATGPGRVLIAVYAVFALSATARAGVQLATRFHEAPVAYLLSALAGVVYILATIGLARTGPAARRLAWTAVSVELTGVLVVGTLSLADHAAFPRSTVWSDYGSGYGWVPLVLPVIGMAWLRRTGRAAPAPATPRPGADSAQ